MFARIGDWFLDCWDEWRDAPLGWKLALVCFAVALVGKLTILALLIAGTVQ